MNTAIRTLVLAAGLALCHPAAAVIVRFHYESVVTSIEVPAGHPIEGRLAIGDTVSGTLQYDLTLHDVLLNLPAVGIYEALPAGNNRFRAMGGNGFLFDSSLIERPFFVATVDDGHRFDTLLVNMSGDTTPSTLARPDTQYVEMGFLLETSNTGTFLNDGLPTSLSLEQFELAGIDFFGSGAAFPTFLIHTTMTSLSTMPPMADGDFNGNGSVEQGDLDLALLHWGQPAGLAPASWIGPLPLGLIDQAELDAVLLNWGTNFAALGVPEPTTSALLLILLVLPLARKLLPPRIIS